MLLSIWNRTNACVTAGDSASEQSKHSEGFRSNRMKLQNTGICCSLVTGKPRVSSTVMGESRINSVVIGKSQTSNEVWGKPQMSILVLGDLE